MSDPALLPLRWQTREPPLAPIAAAATGPAARALAQRLLAMPDDRLSTLTGVAGPELLLVLGPEESLPWVDGAQYLGRDPDAPGLLLPTALRPAVPLPLVERAAMFRRRNAPMPMALVLDPPLLVPLEDARPVDRTALLQWLGAAA